MNNIIKFIYNISSINLLILVIVICILVAVISVFVLAKDNLPNDVKYKQNEVLTALSANVGVMYAILAGFTLLYVMNNFDKCEQIVSNEASEVISIYYTANDLPDPIKTKIKLEMNHYIDTVLSTEWPKLTDGIINNSADANIDNLTNIINAYHPNNIFDIQVREKLLEQIITLYDLHKNRNNSATMALNQNFWLVFILAAFFTIIINGLYGMDKKTHIIGMMIFACTVGLVLYLVIVMDRPFLGEFSIRPTELQLIKAKTI